MAIVETYPGLTWCDNEFKFGFNADIDIGTEDVWTQGGDYPFPAAAAETTIVSASANDAAAGTGARTVRVIGLDSNYNTIAETVTLNGATPVTLTNQYLRIQRSYVLTAGSGGVNAGAIDIKHAATIIGQIAASEGQTLMSIYTVPAEYTTGAYLVHWDVSVTGGPSLAAIARLQSREYNGAWRTRVLAEVGVAGEISKEFPLLCTLFPPKTDIRIRATAATNNTGIASDFILMLKK